MKTAIVTGANRGVGYEIVKVLHASGYKVISLVRNVLKTDKFLHEISEVYQLDVTNFKEIEKFFDKYKDICLDLLVNNAGGGASPTYIKDETPENFKYAYDLNVVGPMYLSKLFVPCMQKSNSPTIVFITSMGGKIPYRGGGNYTNAKRGEIALADTIRLEFSQYKIKVVEVCPGTINTQKEQKNNALTAEDMAEVIRWISSLPSHMNINLVELNHINASRFS